MSLVASLGWLGRRLHSDIRPAVATGVPDLIRSV